MVALAGLMPRQSLANWEKVDPRLLRALETEEVVTFHIIMTEQADLSGAASLATKVERTTYVFERLVETAARTQQGILQHLTAEGVTFQPYYIYNVIEATGGHSTLQWLAARADIARIVSPPNPQLEPVTIDRLAQSAPEAVEWNVTRVGAPDVWAMGFNGEGMVVGDNDTGVQYDHPALVNKYRGNLGGGVFDHNYNWWDAWGGAPSPTPVDYDGHGTHTMGTMVGDDGGSNQIGVAPGAQWVACAGLNVECLQFFLAPWDLSGANPDPTMAPDSVNNSWYDPSGYDYRPIIVNMNAAGIAVIKSAGNNGPGCSSISNPGYVPEIIATAAFAQGDTIASFSSRGPMSNYGETILKPEVAAPGVNVRSSVPGGGYEGGWSGTSMAAPHTTALVALIWQAAPCLMGDVPTTKDIMMWTAEPKIDAQCTPFVDHPNDVWGWGILDAEAAVNMAIGYCGDDFRLSVTPAAQQVCAVDDAVYDIEVEQIGGFVDPVTLSAFDYPAGATASFDVNPVTPPGLSQLTIGDMESSTAGSYLIEIMGVAPTSTHTTTVGLDLFTEAPALTPVLLSPPDGDLTQPLAPSFDWEDLANTTSYNFELDLTPLFASPVLTATGLVDSEFAASALDGGTCYWWRAQGANACGESLWSDPFHFATVLLGASFYDDIESGDVNWTHQAAQGVDHWTISEAQSHSPTHAWFVPDDNVITDSRLWNTTAITIEVGSTMSFWHRYQFEGSAFDGSVLEISTNGGSTWSDLGTYITANGYNGTISSGYSNPLAGRQGWVGDLTTWTEVTVDLNSFAGQSVNIRWRFGADSSVSDVGWYIDDVQINTPLDPNPAPTLVSITPDSGPGNLPTPVVIEGTGFVGTPSLMLGDVWLVDVVVVDSTTIQATVPAGLAIGVYDLKIYNGDCQEAELLDAYTVEAGASQFIFLPLVQKGE